MKRLVVLVGVGLCWLTLVSSAVADEQPADDGAEAETWESHYAEGLRHYAEGREHHAVNHLFRAYGIEPSAQVMELIVEVYDRMGHCEAAARQQAYYQGRYGEDDAEVELNLCEETGTLIVDCESQHAGVVINDGIEAGCGHTVVVPAHEEHRISWKGTAVVQRTSVASGKRVSVETPEDEQVQQAAVSRLPGVEGAVPKLPFEMEPGAQVPRLTLPSGFDESPYRVVKTSDGLYRVWSVKESGEDGESADVQIICPDDAQQRDLECVLLRD